MKAWKYLSSALALTLLISQLSIVKAETIASNAVAINSTAKVNAIPTSSPVMVNSKTIGFDVFNINDNNYFKLRDIAMALNGTTKSFEIAWDEDKNAISMTSNKAYTPVGGELAAGSKVSNEAKVTTSKVYLDNKEIQLTAYNIGDNNYFKLSDISKVLGFTVNLDEKANTVSITTSVPWTPVKSIDFSSKHNVMIKNDDGSLTPMDVPYFKSTLIAPGTWQILADGDYIYLVEGDNEALVIDSGYGAGNIREYCQTLTQKPIKNIVNTHYHFDHTANNAYFDCAYMSADTKANATIPYPSFAGINFPKDYPTEIIGDGYKFQLGNRELEVFEIPNHTVGGIALLDRRERILFSGDEILKADGISLNCSVAQFEQNMSKLAAHRSEFDKLCGGPGIVDATAVDNFLANAQYILSGKGTPQPKESNMGQGSGQGAGQSSTDQSTQKIYVRQQVRSEDRGAPQSNVNLVQMTYSNCTITYDSCRIKD